MTHRWQQQKPPPSHADDWLITYADMITLLLCFFAIFLIVSTTKKETAEKPVTHAISVETKAPPKPETPPSPTVLPGVFLNNLSFRKLGPDDFVKAEPIMEEPAAKPAEQTVLPPASPAIETPAAKIEVPSEPESAPTPSEPTPQIAEHSSSPGNANFEQKGDRITTLEINSAAFFDSGSASVSATGKTLLQNIAINLKGEQFKDYIITVEGHTDDTPIDTSQFPSNWELSTARAAAVVHFLLDQGIPAAKLRAVGYADTMPKVPNRDAGGNPIPTNQLQNRRVVIKLEKIDRAH